MASRFLQELARRVLIFDGSMGATIQNMDLDIERDYLGHENCVDLLVRSRPDLIQSLHESFLQVGADAVETDTFGANKLVFSEFHDDVVGWTRAINREAAQIARAACERYATSDKPRFVIGSIGPGTKLLTLGHTTWDRMLDSYAEQARGLIDGGVDAFIIETCQDLLQVKCAINACLKALDELGKGPLDIPIMVSVTIETTGTMLLGSEIAAAVHALRPYPIMSLGLNCATGPTEMGDHVEFLAKNWDRFISVIPNAGLPILVNGRTSFPLSAEPFAETLARFVEHFGVNIVGGCCGTQPEHIGRLAERVGERASADRGLTEVRLTHDAERIRLATAPAKGEPPVHFTPPAPCVTSLYAPVEYRQENSFLIIGERMNASGSKKFKRLLEEENWDEIISLAREQKREGANVLDINVDYAGRDNARDMAEIVSRVVRQVDCPIMIDSTQPATIEAGLRHAPGKCIINSTNFEDGEEKFDLLCSLARTYGAAIVIGTIDEDKEAAMARTAERKFAIARRGIERATVRHGMDLADLFIDPLVLPISTGMESDRRSALELIEGTRRIRAAYPECQITCGLSNVSFGLHPAARVVLNSVFLHELMEAGMTSAIVHASKIEPLNRIDDRQRQAALDLIYDRRATPDHATADPLQHFIDLFKDAQAGTVEVKRADRTIEQILRDHIIDGEKRDLHAHLDAALVKYAPLAIINDHLLDGMKTVGELFGSGQMQLPFVLQSAEVMKMAVAYLEPKMEKVAGSTKGTIVLATVKGDVHDIGKNLVDIILSNNGYRVINLGIKQPLHSIIEAARQHAADAVGMSGLLVKSVGVMEENLREMNAQSLRIPVLLGGAALTRHYAESHLRGVYHGPLYYGKDAFEGLRVCEALTGGGLQQIDREVEARLTKRAETEEKVSAMRARDGAKVGGGAGGVGGVATATTRSSVATDVPVPTPPFWGDRLVESIDLDDIYPFINTVALFRGQWGFKRGSRTAEEYEREIEETVQPIFQRLQRICREEKILRPQVVYGWWPCNAEGDDLVIYDAQDHAREIERFTFPRQSARERLCISDFFRPVESGERDVVGFSCVTMGVEASHRARQLFERNEYTEYLYLHGMGVECAEALAELWHKRMRAELGIGQDDSPRIRELFTQHYRGSRYSFGYPACPEMSDQEKLFRLLKPERIGCTLTDNWQIDPEQSTSAIIVHHPAAKYFNV
ncbi:MAG: homocysteine S-methyltransferase family protein [Phycisphaeraceae bacterium]|nr:MAG: homocysteine S-methyltransferase family protein [Phycisphaeraceae bacterium]